MESSEHTVLSPNTYRKRSPTRYCHFCTHWGVHGTLLTRTKQELGSPLMSLWSLVYTAPAAVLYDSIWVSLKTPPICFCCQPTHARTRWLQSVAGELRKRLVKWSTKRLTAKCILIDAVILVLISSKKESSSRMKRMKKIALKRWWFMVQFLKLTQTLVQDHHFILFHLPSLSYFHPQWKYTCRKRDYHGIFFG